MSPDRPLPIPAALFANDAVPETVREEISAPKQRKAAARALAVALQAKHRLLIAAELENDPEAITRAAMALAQDMNSNIEFIVWALKSFGGMYAPPPERRR